MKNEWKILPNLFNALITHRYPVALIHFVTQRCNAKCPHCFVDFKTAEKELTLEQIEKIASSTGNCLKNVSLTGGEPFIRDDFFEIANIWYSNSTIDSMVITTNGSIPDKIECFCKNAIKKDIPASFFFSYDFIEEKHDEYRKIKDLHIKLAESYKIVKSYKNKFNATFNITVTPENMDSAFRTYEYMRDTLKVQNINCTLFRGKKADILDEDTRQNLMNTYKKIQTQKNKDFDNNQLEGFNGKSLTSMLVNSKNKILWKYVAKTFETKKYISPCTAGSLIGVIYNDGKVTPCEARNESLGDLKNYDYNFLNCWHSNDGEKIRKDILNSKCCCTNECFWLLNILSSPKYYNELSFQVIKNFMRTNGK